MLSGLNKVYTNGTLVDAELLIDEEAGHCVSIREEEGEDGLSQLDAAVHQQSGAWWEDPITGSPSSLEETCMMLIDSGFRPDSCAALQARLREVAKKVVKTFQTKFRFEVPMSCSAFIVPGEYLFEVRICATG